MHSPATVTELVPVSIPGLVVVRQTTEELRARMKTDYVVARMEEGRSEWWTQGQIWRSGPGSIQLKAPGDVHRDVAHDGPITFQVVVLPSRELESLRDEVTTRATPQMALPHLAAGDERARAFHRLHDAIGDKAERLSLEVAVTEAISAFVRLREPAAHQTRPVKRAMDYLRSRISDSFTLDDLATHSGLDKFHLCRAFRAQIGMPPHTYLTNLRIARAKRLLERGVTASEVASLVGLYDQSQLNRHFRRIVGTTPGRYASRPAPGTPPPL
ncbi:MAG TPA: AraC family transcriptional regulator [Polyangiaceae bacterium]|nr:AraC family transcriptional regulator [Polyangiaceae bacterium]